MFWLVLSGPASFAQIRVPRLVSDGMVLQREMPLRIWGFGTPGEKVTVKVDTHPLRVSSKVLVLLGSIGRSQGWQMQHGACCGN